MQAKRLVKILCIGFFASLLSGMGLEAHANKAKQRILVIHSYHQQLPWTQGIQTGIEQGFNDEDVEIYHEYLDAKRHPAIAHGPIFLQELTLKYKQINPDLLIVSDDPGLNLYLPNRHKHFPNVPLVYLGINKLDPNLLQLPNATGVFEIHNFIETALGALQQNKTNNLIVINDSSETGQANRQRIEELKEHPQTPDEIIVYEDLTADTLVEQLSQHPKHWPIYVMGQLRQASPQGPLLNFKRTGQILNRNLPNPLYTASMTFIEHGFVGGKILDAEHHAQQAVNLAHQILSGTNPNDIPAITKAKTIWTFDRQELERFNLPLSQLPPNRKIINEDRSTYERYKGFILLTVFAFSITLLVIFLLSEVIRRKAIAEKILRDNERRYIDLAEAGANIFWEINPELKFTYFFDGDTPNKDDRNLLGQTIHSVLERDNIDFDWPEFMSHIEARQAIKDFIYRQHTGPEAVRIFKINGKPIFDETHTFLGYRGIQREITQEFELINKIAYQASHDWLTGLVNRYEFNEQLKKVVQYAQQDQGHAVLCYIDLDQFKIVNDTAGHHVGDQLLIELSRVLRTSISEEDILARLGGDEFGLILKNASLQKSEELCGEIIQALKNYRFHWNKRQFSIDCSIGIVPISQYCNNDDDYLVRADLACYNAKKLGRGRIYIDKPGESGLDRDKYLMTQIANLSQYLEEDRFFLMRQDIQALNGLNDQEEHHYEVLVRFKDNQDVVISPSQFIPAMEQYGVISILDRWVMERLLISEHHFTQNALISINISGHSLSDHNFRDFTVQLLKQSRVPTTSLCFEITETAAIRHLQDAQRFIYTMKDLGAKFALDDFGSGLSSFSYLKTLPVDFLKIDGSLIQNIAQSASDRVMVQCINDMAHTMGMKTIAEFVEDKSIFNCLKTIGIDYGQGYKISYPVPLTI